jgi:hypothetical protein
VELGPVALGLLPHPATPKPMTPAATTPPTTRHASAERICHPSCNEFLENLFLHSE